MVALPANLHCPCTSSPELGRPVSSGVLEVSGRISLGPDSVASDYLRVTTGGSKRPLRTTRSRKNVTHVPSFLPAGTPLPGEGVAVGSVVAEIGPEAVGGQELAVKVVAGVSGSTLGIG